MKNGHVILGERYTNAIRKDEGTLNKMYSISRKISGRDNLQAIHDALYGLLEAGYDIKGFRQIENLVEYVSKKQARNQLNEITTEDIEEFHKLFTSRFGK